MQIKTLKLHNFQSYTDETVDFSEGVSILYGENGAGKSSLLRGIFAGLFQTGCLSEISSDLNIASLVNKNADSGSVELTFTVNDEEYTVYWVIDVEPDEDGERKGSTETCILSSSALEDSIEGVRDVGSAVSDLLNMDETAFVSSVYVQQQELMKLLSASKKERKQIFDNLLGLSRIDTYLNRLHESRREIKSLRKDVESQLTEVDRQLQEKQNLSELETKVSELETKKDTKKSRISEIESEVSELQSEKSELQTEVNQLQEVEERLDELESEYDSLLDTEDELESTITDLESRVAELQSEKQELVDKKQSLLSNSEYTELPEVTEEIESLDTAIDELRTRKSDAEKSHATTTQELSQVETQIAETTQAIDDCETDIESINEDIETKETRRTQLVDKKDQLLANESIEEQAVESVKQNLESKLDEAETAVTRLQTTKERIEEEIQASEDEVFTAQNVSRLWVPESVEISSEGQSSAEDITPEETRKIAESADWNSERVAETIRKLESDLESHLAIDTEVLQDNLEEIESKIVNQNAEVSYCNSQLDVLEEIEDLQEEIAGLTEEIDELTEDQETVREQLQDETEHKQDLVSQKSTLESELGELDEQIASVTTQITTLKSKRESLSDIKEFSTQISEISNKIENLELQVSQKSSELDSVEEKIEEIDDEIIEVEDKLFNKDSVEEEYNEVVERLKTSKQQKKTVEEEYTTALSDYNSVKEQLKTVQSLTERSESLSEEHSRYSTLYQEIESVIDTYTQVKKNARKENIALVEYYANEVFTEVYQNQTYDRLKMDEDYTVTLLRTDNTEIDPELASGGESALVNIALRAGVYRAISEREGEGTLPPFILDEPTTFLDSGHIDKLDSLIRTMREWDVPQVFIVSHNERLIDTADTTIHITKQNGVSDAMVS